METKKTFLKIAEPIEIECSDCGEMMKVSRFHCEDCAKKRYD